MAKAAIFFLFFLVVHGPASVALAVQLAERRAVAVQKISSSKPGCGHLSMMSAKRMQNKAKTQIPGAGMQPGNMTPFQTSYMDGYYMVGCIKDDMYLHGDKFGDGKFSYTLEPVSGVSIVKYSEMVPKEDSMPMTLEVCFAFCRTIPDMSFFGLTHGRECYCTPYYNQIAGDDSDCDAVCEGNPTTMCGGMAKSTIFEMHACDDSTANLEAASAAAKDERLKLVDVLTGVAASAKAMQAGAATLQKSFGKVGDSAATTLMQAAKVFAGKLEHAADDGTKLATKMEELVSSAASAAGADSSLETLTKQLKDVTTSAKGAKQDLTALDAESTAPNVGLNTSAALYYPAMYFVDKEFVDVPATCAGRLAANPLIADYDGCAAACEVIVGKCVGFSYFGKANLCFLLSTLDTLTYYTKDCGGPAPPAAIAPTTPPSLVIIEMQMQNKPETTCAVKFATFEGKSIKPDPKGKCTTCLGKLSKADRCFE